MEQPTFERWVYRDGPKDGAETLYLLASQRDWFRVESVFKLELVKHYEGLTPEQVGEFCVEALRYKGPEAEFLEKLEGIVASE